MNSNFSINIVIVCLLDRSNTFSTVKIQIYKRNLKIGWNLINVKYVAEKLN